MSVTSPVSTTAVQATGIWKVFNEGQANEVTALQDINLTVETGSCLGIVGQVGSGKTALLHAILGEMEKDGGTVDVRGDYAYVAQTAFIVNATIKDNILFGQALDAGTFSQTYGRLLTLILAH